MTREEAVEILREKYDENEFYFAEHDEYPEGINGEYQTSLMIALKALQEPEIVHCKDCEYWLGSGELKQCVLAGYLIGERGYCLYGKKAG